MKSKLVIMAITIILMLSSVIYVYANTETTVTLSTDKTEIKVGETFTVTVKATCPDGINGVDTTYSYDTEKLELTSANVANSNFSSLGVDNQITVISNATESIQSADIYTLTFKVKEGVTVNSTAVISLADTLLDSDASTDSEHTISAQEISVKIVESAEVTPPATDDEDGEQTPPATDDEDGEQTPPTTDDEDGEQTPPATDDGDGEQTPPATDDENGEQTPPTSGDEDENKDQPTTGGTTVVVGDNKDTSTVDKELPKAGINTSVIIVAVMVSIFAFVIYKKNQKYEDIR